MKVFLLLGHNFTLAYTGGLLPLHLPLVHPPLYHLESFLYYDVIISISSLGCGLSRGLDGISLSTTGSQSLVCMKQGAML